MRGLLLLTPIVSCVCAFVSFLLDGGFWITAAAFLLGGPSFVFLLALMLSGRDREDDGPSNTDPQ